MTSFIVIKDVCTYVRTMRVVDRTGRRYLERKVAKALGWVSRSTRLTPPRFGPTLPYVVVCRIDYVATRPQHVLCVLRLPVQPVYRSSCRMPLLLGV
jgi:hypothetical protein